MRTYKDIDKIYNKAGRYNLGTHKITPFSAIYGEMVWLPAIFHRQVHSLKLWNDILGINQEHLIRKVFLLDYHSRGESGQEINYALKVLRWGNYLQV